MTDLISRQDAIDACHDWNEGEEAYYFGDIIEKRLQNLPSADRPKGEWIYIDEPIIGNPYGRYRCSECNLEEPFKSNFCLNCGADMRGADMRGVGDE